MIASIEKIPQHIPLTDGEIALLKDLYASDSAAYLGRLINYYYTIGSTLRKTAGHCLFVPRKNSGDTLWSSVAVHLHHIRLLTLRGFLKEESAMSSTPFARTSKVLRWRLQRFNLDAYSQLNELRVQIALGTLKFGYYDADIYTP